MSASSDPFQLSLFDACRNAKAPVHSIAPGRRVPNSNHVVFVERVTEGPIQFLGIDTRALENVLANAIACFEGHGVALRARNDKRILQAVRRRFNRYVKIRVYLHKTRPHKGLAYMRVTITLSRSGKGLQEWKMHVYVVKE